MNHSELQAALASLLNRKDLTASIPTFIALGEAQFNREVRHWRMENRAFILTDGQFVPLPDEWVETLRIHEVKSGRPMLFLSRQAMQEMRADAARNGTTFYDGCQLYYRHSEDNYEFYPVPTKPVEIEAEYYERIPSLGSLDKMGVVITQNWLLKEAPDLYLYGCALHSAPHLHDDERVPTWLNLYGAAMTVLNANAKRSEYSGSSLRLKNRGMVQSR